MKNILLIIFAISGLFFAALYYIQYDKASLYKDVIEELEKSAERVPDLEAEATALKTDKLHSELENEQLKQRIEKLESTIAELRDKNKPQTAN